MTQPAVHWVAEWEECFGERMYNDRSWNATIGLPIETVQWVYNRCQVSTHPVSPRELLIALNWCCEYRGYACARISFGMSEKQYGHCVWRTLQRIDNALPQVFHVKLIFVAN